MRNRNSQKENLEYIAYLQSEIERMKKNRLAKNPETNKGKKFDTDKLRTDLVPVSTIEQLAEVLGFGANKYGDHNWKSGIDYNRLYGATLRHLIAFWGGEDNDPESGLAHLSHAMCNIAFLIEYQSKRNNYHNFDNRRNDGKNS